MGTKEGLEKVRRTAMCALKERFACPRNFLMFIRKIYDEIAGRIYDSPWPEDSSKDVF